MPRTTLNCGLARFSIFIPQTHQRPCPILTQKSANKHTYSVHRSSPTPSL